MRQKLVGLFLAIVLLAIPMVALASGVSNALYLANVQVTENGTAATTNTATTFSANLTTMMNATATDASMQYAGSPVPFMPAPPGSSTWVTYVDDIGLTQNIDYSLYLDGATGGKYRYFPGDAGMSTTSDNVTLPVTDNFTISQIGWINTETGTSTGKNLVYKEEAFITYADNSGNVTSSILGADTETVPTGDADATGYWGNGALAYDANTATGADMSNALGSPADSWGTYIYFTHAGIDCYAISYYAEADADFTMIDVDVQYGATWHNVFEGAHTNLTWETHRIADGEVVTATGMRVRFYNDNVAGQTEVGLLREVNFLAINEAATVTATGVSSGEHTVTIAIEER